MLVRNVHSCRVAAGDAGGWPDTLGLAHGPPGEAAQAGDAATGNWPLSMLVHCTVHSTGLSLSPTHTPVLSLPSPCLVSRDGAVPLAVESHISPAARASRRCASSSCTSRPPPTSCKLRGASPLGSSSWEQGASAVRQRAGQRSPSLASRVGDLPQKLWICQSRLRASPLARLPARRATARWASSSRPRCWLKRLGPPPSSSPVIGPAVSLPPRPAR